MDKELKAKWVRALCSGKYPQQAEGELKNSNGYCCLGVLAELKGKSTAGPYIRTGYHGTGYRYHFIPEDAQKALAEVNDDGVPFELIAGLVKETL